MQRGFKVKTLITASIIGVFASLLFVNTSLASESNLGPGYEAQIEPQLPIINYSLATGYKPEYHDELEQFCEEVSEASIDELLNTGVKISKDVGTPQEIVDYMTLAGYDSWLPHTAYSCDYHDGYYTFKYKESIEDMNKMVTTAEQTRNKFNEFISNYKPTLDSIKELYEDLCWIPYDYIPDNNEGMNNTYGALVLNKTQCLGKAMLFRKSLTALGIECYNVIGYTNGGYHAWNAFRLDDKIYTVDSTYGGNWKGIENGIWNWFIEDGSMTFGNRTIENIY